MGVDCVLFQQLVELSTRFQPKGRSLMLGRQKFEIRAVHARFYDPALRAASRAESHTEFLQEDGYSERLFSKLGLGEIETMDYASFEGNVIEQDLNESVPDDLHNTFDFIFDGGTIEHVFDAPQALENVYHMLKPGGRFVSANGLNGFVGHGMYQFGPELVWTFWKRKCQCEVIQCLGLPRKPRSKSLAFRDAAETGKRLKLRGKVPEGRVYLYYEIEKTSDHMIAGSALQSDYQTRWSAHDTGELR